MNITFKFKPKSRTFTRLGADPIFDFCNTLEQSENGKIESLFGVQSLVQFVKQVYGFNLKITSQDFKEALRLRESVRDYFLAVIEKRSVSSAMAKINSQLSRSWFCYRLAPLKPKKNVEVSQIKRVFYRPTATSVLARSFVDFIGRIEADRVKKCHNPDCSLLFYDESKNNTRQWCSMKSCGNIMKARAFYKRKKMKLKKTVSIR